MLRTRSCLATSIATGLLLFAPVARAAPTTEGAACRVTLSKISYDDPDADDAEFLELHVERFAGSSGGAAHAPAAPPGSCGAGGAAGDDGGPHTDGGSTPGALTLADCGLASVELVNGASGACEAYRELPLGEVVVPGDDYVVVCAADSSLAAAGACDLTAAGRSALKNGWLQNGPNDGLRLVDTAGAAVSLAYEGGPACFAGGALAVPEESGAFAGAPGDAVDDVAVWCPGGYVLAGSDRAARRAANPCAPSPGEEPADAGHGAVSSPLSGEAGAAPWAPEFAPAPSATVAAPGDTPPGWDAGTGPEAADSPGAGPRPPSCSTTRGDASSPRWARALAALAVAAAARRFRQRTRR